MKDKRGQKIESPTVHVAVFIIIMALFIVAYLVLIPKVEREKLLGEGEEYWPEGYEEEIEEGEKEILLSVVPGRVYPYSRYEEEKNFASINLYSTTQTSPILLAGNAVVSRGLFSNNYKEYSFTVENLADLESLGLFFNIVESKGNLIVIINDNEVYNGKVRGDSPIIKLPATHLKKYNKLILKASHPGLFVLSTNKFVLKDVQLIKQISLINKVETRSFVVEDLDGVRKGELGFFINCLKIMGKQGTLKVGLNGKNVYIGKIVCDSGRVMQDIVKDNFIDGRNVLTFEIDQGEYVLEQVKLELDIEELQEPRYWFSVDEKLDDYKLKMNFEETSDVKRATITINGNNVYLDEYRNIYSKDISDFVEEGENYIKISAKNEFVVDLLEVVSE